MNKEARILVTGATGLVGSAITRALLDRGYTNIVGTYRTKNPYKMYKDYAEHINKGYIRFVQVDLTDQQQVRELFQNENPEYVFLAAAKVGGIWANNIYRADFIYQNLQIECNVIHQSYISGVKKLLFLGSTCIYPRDCPQPMKEEYLLTAPLEYTNEPYAVAKIAGIRLCESYNIQHGTNFIAVMPTNLYGYWDNFDLETSHVIPALLRKMHLAKALQEENWKEIRRDLSRYLLKDVDESSSEDTIVKTLAKYGITYQNGKAKVEIWGTGNPKREFLWADDLADACLFIMERVDFTDILKLVNPLLSAESSLLEAVKKGYQIRNIYLNIGAGEEISIKELVNLIKDVVGFKGDIVFNPSKPDGTPRKLTDVSRLQKLGWTYKTSLEEGLKKLYAWYTSHGKA